MRFFRWESWAGGSRGLVGVVDRWESWEVGGVGGGVGGGVDEPPQLFFKKVSVAGFEPGASQNHKYPERDEAFTRPHRTFYDKSETKRLPAHTELFTTRARRNLVF